MGAMPLFRRLCPAALLAAVCWLPLVAQTPAAGLPPAVTMDPKVPTPKSVLGHAPGDDFYLATYTDAVGYLQKLAASSKRIELRTVGKTTRGLDMDIALISAPENLAQLDHYRDVNRQLTWARGLDDNAAHALARQGKVFIHIDGGMHSTEVAGGQQSITLAYKLVASQNDPEVDAILHNVILVLWPTLNPDGQDEVVKWYRQNVGTRFEVSPLPDLYQEYVGHDNNRDGYMNNMKESQVITAQELIWNPEVFYTHHQTAPFPARIFIPPFVEPISSNIHPLMMRWLNELGVNMAAYLDEHNMPGAISRVGFDNWYPGFQDFTGIFRNSIAFFTETALYGYATPHFYTVRDFPPNYRSLTAGIFYSSPWKGGWWRLRDAVDYMQAASMSVLQMASKYHEQMLYNKYVAGRDTIANFTANPPYAYVIPAGQVHRTEAADLARIFMVNGVEVHQATAAFAANGRSYAAGSWVILMNQPYANLVKELMEPQDYPSILQDGTPVRPYDVAGWTLPLQMGVDADAVLEPLDKAQLGDLKPLTQWSWPAGAIQGSGSVFTLSPATNQHFDAVNRLLAAGARVGFAADGTAVVTGAGRDQITSLTHKGLEVTATAAAPEKLAAVTRLPRVGLYRAWQPNIDEGWTRWILENYGFKPITLRDGDIQASDLNARLDVIILPDSRPEGMLHGFAPGSVPGKYEGGIEEQGVNALRQFVQNGGTLICFNNASLFAIEQFGLPVKNVLDKLKPSQFYSSGSLLRVEVPAAAPGKPPLAGDWGMSGDVSVMFENGPAFETDKGFQGAVLASYPQVNPLQSGYLLGAEKIEGKAAALVTGFGQGRIYLFGFKPQWRAESHGTYKFFFNAIYDSPARAGASTFGDTAEKAHR